MRQTLFRIPLEGPWSLGPFGEVAGFGFGLVLVLWVLYGLFQAFRHRGLLKQQPAAFAWGCAWWAAVAVVIIQIPSFAGATVGRMVLPTSIPVFGYGFMLLLGFAGAIGYGMWRVRREGGNGEIVADLAMWIFLSGIIGGRLFYLIQYGEYVFRGKNGLPEILFAIINLPEGGLVLYGGVIGGIVGYLTFCELRRIRPLVLGDMIIPSVFIGLGFGRTGCFLNGCCYGHPAELPWSVSFPAGSVPFNALVAAGVIPPDAPYTIPLHPTQIYSAITGFLLAALLMAFYRYRRRDGEVLALGWLLYPITRFLVEFLRSDELGQFGTEFTISQWISIGMFLVALGFSFFLMRLPAERKSLLANTGSPLLGRVPSGKT